MESYNTHEAPAMKAQTVTYGSDWQSGLCNCCADMPVCLLGWCCPCILFGKIAERIDGNTSCAVACLIWCALEYFAPGCGCLYSCGFRKRLREMHGIPEGRCPDFLLHYCCTNCAYCQEYREIKARSTCENGPPVMGSVTVPPKHQSMMS